MKKISYLYRILKDMKRYILSFPITGNEYGCEYGDDECKQQQRQQEEAKDDDDDDDDNDEDDTYTIAAALAKLARSNENELRNQCLKAVRVLSRVRQDAINPSIEAFWHEDGTPTRYWSKFVAARPSTPPAGVAGTPTTTTTAAAAATTTTALTATVTTDDDDALNPEPLGNVRSNNSLISALTWDTAAYGSLAAKFRRLDAVHEQKDDDDSDCRSDYTTVGCHELFFSSI